MRGLFIHDHRFLSVDGQYFSEGKITDASLSRYLNCCSMLVLLTRLRVASESHGLSKISSPFVTFCPVDGDSMMEIFLKKIVVNVRRIWVNLRAADVVIIRLPSFLGISAWVMCEVMSKRYFVELVGDPEQAIRSSRTGMGSRLFASVFKVLTKFAVGRATGVIYVTKEKLQNLFPTHGFAAAASNVEIESVSRVTRCAENSSPLTTPRIGVIASYSNPYKGLDVAIRAIAQCNEHGVRPTLHVLGSGDERRYVELAAKLGIGDQVHFDGRLEGGAAVAGWLDELDIYVQPSLTEGLPRSLIEAMSRGLPCVASCVGGVPELLAADWLVPPGDPRKLASKILLLSHSYAARRDSSVRNLVKAEEFTVSTLGEIRDRFWDRVRATVCDVSVR